MPLFLGKATDISAAGETYYRVKFAEAEREWMVLSNKEEKLTEYLQRLQTALVWIDTIPHLRDYVQDHRGCTFSQLVMSYISCDNRYNNLKELYLDQVEMDDDDYNYIRAISILFKLCRKVPDITLRKLRARFAALRHEKERISHAVENLYMSMKLWKEMYDNVTRRPSEITG